MKIRSNDEITHATAKFTDREEPQEAFRKNLRYIEEHPDEGKVLTYYGFGGIGKTALCRELERQLGEDTKSVYFSFERCQDCPDVLKFLGHLLTEKYRFDFSLLNYALYLYELKQGGDSQRPEVRELQDNSFVGALIDAVQLVPVVGGLGSWVLKYADKLQSSTRDMIYRNQAEIQKMDGYAPEDLRKQLPYYFAKDFNRNMEGEAKPLVFFLDTYEQLTNMIYTSAQARVGDEWLYGKDGVIQRIPHVLWVIAGQAKLKWAEYSSEWDSEDSLEQHRMGTLGEQDIRDFLSSAGITEPALVDAIGRQTGGVPVHLDLCVETYYMLRQKGQTPTAGDFDGGVEALAKRFIGNLQGGERDLLELLACMETWRDEDLLDPALNVSDAVYRRVKQLAFIVQDSTGYYLHKAVRDVLYRDCGDLVKRRFDQYLSRQLADLYIPAVDKKRFRVQKLRLAICDLAPLPLEEAARRLQALYRDTRPELLRYVGGEYDFVYFSTLHALLRQGMEGVPVSDEMQLEMLLLEFSACVNQGDFQGGKRLLPQIQSWDVRKFTPELKLFYYKSLGDHYKGDLDWRRQLQCRIECRGIAAGMPGKERDVRQAMQDMTECYTALHDYAKAEANGKAFLAAQSEALDAEPTDEQRLELAGGYLQLAECMYRQSLSEPAAKYLAQAEELLDACENQERLRCIELRASAALCRGDIMRQYGYFDQATEQYTLFGAQVEKLNELCPCEAWRRERGKLGNRMSICLGRQDRPDEALRYAQESMALAQEGYARQRTYDMFNMVYYAQCQLALAYHRMPGKQPQAMELAQALLARLDEEDAEGASGEDAFQLYSTLFYFYSAAKDAENAKQCLDRMGEIVAARYTDEKNYFDAKKKRTYLERQGAFCWNQGRLAQAIPYYEKALRLDRAMYEAAPDPLRAIACAADCKNLADISSKTGRPAEALEYLRRQAQLRKEIYEAGPSVWNLVAYDSAVADIEQFYRERGEAVEGLPWTELRFQLNKQVHRARPSMVTAVNCLRGANALRTQLFRQRRYQDALHYYEDAFPMMSGYDDAPETRDDVMFAHFGMADTLLRLDRPEDALDHARLSVAWPDEIGLGALDNRESLLYRILVELDKKERLAEEAKEAEA